VNVYLVSRTDQHGYDDYDAFVCVAPDAETARRMRPGSGDDAGWWRWSEAGIYERRKHDGTWYVPNHEWAWPNDLSRVKAEQIVCDGEPRVILGSYNAG
jgi:hypothetical protein